MDDIYVYTVPLPAGVNEMVLPCVGGYTVYINIILDDDARIEAYNHAMKHIQHNDFNGGCVQSIEDIAHMRESA